MQEEQQNVKAMKWLDDMQVLADDDAPSWIKSMREAGAEVFSYTGMPTPKWEDWKYTNLRQLSDADYSFNTDAPNIDKLPAPLIENTHRIILINGQYNPELSNAPEGVIVSNILDCEIDDIEQHLVTVGDLNKKPLKALNAAYMRDGLVLKVTKGVMIEKPIEILYYNVGSSNAIYPRVLHWLEEGSSATLIERYIGEGEYFVNTYECIVQEKNSHLKLYRFEEESMDAVHISSTLMQQHRNSTAEVFSYVAGGKLVREDYKCELVDTHVENNIGGVYMVKGDQVHDVKLSTAHFEPHGKSSQYFRGVVDGHAKATFQDKVFVNRNAQKTDSSQLNKTILLSDTAQANFKPELEIYADDVKCSHGAASGQLDADAMFYMRSRGLTKKEAEALLVQAFLNEALEQITNRDVKKIYREKIEAWLTK